jgi:ribonuclease P protein component
LATAQRLRRRGEFAAAVRGGRRAGRGAIVVHLVVPEPDSMSCEPGTGPARTSRAGFVVSKAVGGAVVRNRVKRRLRHLVRTRLAALPAGTDLVVRTQPGAADRSSVELAADLDAALAAALRRGPGSAGGAGQQRASGRQGASSEQRGPARR